jgi:hypothetical protein
LKLSFLFFIKNNIFNIRENIWIEFWFRHIHTKLLIITHRVFTRDKEVEDLMEDQETASSQGTSSEAEVALGEALGSPATLESLEKMHWAVLGTIGMNRVWEALGIDLLVGGLLGVVQ